MLNRTNRLFKNYKRHGYKLEDKARLENFSKECQEAVETAKLIYLANMGKKLNNPNTSHESYWKIIYKEMNKCKAPKIPPLLVNGTFVLKTLDQIYKALVHSHLHYCDTIYHILAFNSQINLGVTLNSLMEKVEWTQYQAALVITGTNRSKLYE